MDLSGDSDSSDSSNKSKHKEELKDVTDHKSAFEHFLKCLQESTEYERERIAYVCHRVVHGGNYPGPVLVSQESFHNIEELTDLAPLSVSWTAHIPTPCAKNWFEQTQQSRPHSN